MPTLKHNEVVLFGTRRVRVIAEWNTAMPVVVDLDGQPEVYRVDRNKLASLGFDELDLDGLQRVYDELTAERGRVIAFYDTLHDGDARKVEALRLMDELGAKVRSVEAAFDDVLDDVDAPPAPDRVRECRCGRDGVKDTGQCAVRGGWGALRPGTYCRRYDADEDPDDQVADLENGPSPDDVPDEARPDCLDRHKGGCQGEAQFRPSLSGTGTPIARCDHHWQERLAFQEEHLRIYPDSPIPPAWFDPEAAGERWDDD